MHAVLRAECHSLTSRHPFLFYNLKTLPAHLIRTSGGVKAEAAVVNLGNRGTMATGICFLDHMIDQLTSHAQLGVTLQVEVPTTATTTTTMEAAGLQKQKPHQDYAGNDMENRPHDLDIFKAAGAALGAALRGLVDSFAATAIEQSCSSTFCCPLDEAFAEATLELSFKHVAAAPHTLNLAPYGTFSKSGRRWIGCYKCEYTTDFFAALAAELGAPLHLRKVRGDNAHHIVESTFKSFARVFRACLDGLVEGGAHGLVTVGEDRVAARRAKLGAGGAGGSAGSGGGSGRTGSRSRSTKETSISANVNLDAAAPPAPGSESNGVGEGISSRVVVNDKVLTELRNACGFYFDAQCDGDVYIDDHHTAEDLSITIGQCLNVALGSKAGLARMGCAEGASGSCLVRVVIDLSNRPHFESDLYGLLISDTVLLRLVCNYEKDCSDGNLLLYYYYLLILFLFAFFCLRMPRSPMECPVAPSVTTLIQYDGGWSTPNPHQ